MFASPTYRPTLSALAATRLADMIDYVTQVTGLPHAALHVTDCEGVSFPDVVTRDGRSTLVYHADLVGPDGIRYRTRFDEDRAASNWAARNTLTVVTGEGETQTESEPVQGPISHAKAVSSALTYARYVGQLSHS